MKIRSQKQLEKALKREKRERLDTEPFRKNRSNFQKYLKGIKTIKKETFEYKPVKLIGSHLAPLPVLGFGSNLKKGSKGMPLILKNLLRLLTLSVIQVEPEHHFSVEFLKGFYITRLLTAFLLFLPELVPKGSS